MQMSFLWNMPNYGTVSFWDTNTTWMAEAATQIDYFITVPPAGATPAEAGSTWVTHPIPDGEYTIFIEPQFRFGTFGHPWEWSLNIFGDLLIHKVRKNMPGKSLRKS